MDAMLPHSTISGAQKKMSVCGFVTKTYSCCMLANFRQDGTCLQKNENVRNVKLILCDFGSFVCAIAGAFCENCTAYQIRLLLCGYE